MPCYLLLFLSPKGKLDLCSLPMRERTKPSLCFALVFLADAMYLPFASHGGGVLSQTVRFLRQTRSLATEYVDGKTTRQREDVVQRRRPPMPIDRIQSDVRIPP